MDGLSDQNSFSEVELKELGSGNGQSPDDNLIEPDGEVETRKPKKKVSLKAVGLAVSAFLGVPEDRNPTDYDPTHPKVKQKQ